MLHLPSGMYFPLFWSGLEGEERKKATPGCGVETSELVGGKGFTGLRNGGGHMTLLDAHPSNFVAQTKVGV